MKLKKSFSFLLCGLAIQLNLLAQDTIKTTPEFLKYNQSEWVDSIMQELTPNERIAQLIMVAAYSNRDKKHKQEILKLIKNRTSVGSFFFKVIQNLR